MDLRKIKLPKHKELDLRKIKLPGYFFRIYHKSELYEIIHAVKRTGHREYIVDWLLFYNAPSNDVSVEKCKKEVYHFPDADMRKHEPAKTMSSKEKRMIIGGMFNSLEIKN